MKKRRTFSARRRALARKIAGCRLMQPPELCARCVWALKESGRPACLGALRAENRVYKKRLQQVKGGQGSREQGGVDSSPAERAAGIRQKNRAEMAGWRSAPAEKTGVYASLLQ